MKKFLRKVESSEDEGRSEQEIFEIEDEDEEEHEQEEDDDEEEIEQIKEVEEAQSRKRKGKAKAHSETSKVSKRRKVDVVHEQTINLEKYFPNVKEYERVSTENNDELEELGLDFFKYY